MTAIPLTDRANARLEAYILEVKGAFSANREVDLDEVVAGIHEHLEEEFPRRDPGSPVTADELDRVLERLGDPARWSSQVHEGRPKPPMRPGLVTAAVLGLPGLLLTTFERPVPGIALLLVGALVARLAIEGDPRSVAEAARRAGENDSALSDRFLRLFWTLAALALVVTSMLAPAALVWGSAQIGGALDGWANPGAPPIPGTRSAEFWRWVAGIAGMTTALWWCLLGAAVVRWNAGLNRLLGPAYFRVSRRSARVLMGVAAIISLPSAWTLLT
jgi:hypothetical protein